MKVESRQLDGIEGMNAEALGGALEGYCDGTKTPLRIRSSRGRSPRLFVEGTESVAQLEDCSRCGRCGQRECRYWCSGVGGILLSWLEMSPGGRVVQRGRGKGSGGYKEATDRSGAGQEPTIFTRKAAPAPRLDGDLAATVLCTRKVTHPQGNHRGNMVRLGSYSCLSLPRTRMVWLLKWPSCRWFTGLLQKFRSDFAALGIPVNLAHRERPSRAFGHIDCGRLTCSKAQPLLQTVIPYAAVLAASIWEITCDCRSARIKSRNSP